MRTIRGNVVHLVDELVEDVPAPSAIGFGRRISPAAAAWLWVLLTAATAGTALLLAALWASESPGWWFDGIFTVMPVVILGGCAVAILESRLLGRLEHRLSGQWAASHSDARPSAARVVDRDVRLTEHGSVSSFVITVESHHGERVRARSYPTGPMDVGRTLLQPQVPSVGAAARIWAVPGAAADAPCVVEAVDPSAVASGNRTD